MNISTEHIEQLALQIKKEQEVIKKDIKPGVMAEMRSLFEKCFMMPKNKKEHFITKEKLQLEFLKILQHQKKFKPSENIFAQIKYLAVFDLTSNMIGRLLSIDFINQTATFKSHYGYSNDRPPETKHFRDINLFDYNSIALEYFYKMQNNSYGDINYIDTYNFLNGEDVKSNGKLMPFDANGYGVEVVDTETHPVLLDIVDSYNVPVEKTKERRRLFKLHSVSLEVMEEFTTVKEAAAKLGISASTISNVLCQGKSAMKYTEAGDFKWTYSDQPNLKYQMQKTA